MREGESKRERESEGGSKREREREGVSEEAGGRKGGVDHKIKQHDCCSPDTPISVM